jgi:hypothetical protein
MSAGAKFLIGFVGGIAAVIVGLGALFTGLGQTDRLKAPAFANRLSFDEKLRYWQQRPLGDVEVMAVGSSTTLHGIDGEELRIGLGTEGGIGNFGVQDIRVNQIRFLADTFLDRHDEVERVVMVSTTLDFKNCADAEPRFFNPDHAIDYLDGGWWQEIFYQFKYLDLSGVFKRARSIARQRSSRADLDSVAFDDHGGLLLTVPRELINDRVWFGDPITLDPDCYESLHDLAESVRARGLPFTYVIAPMRPGYLDGRDPDGALVAEHRQRLSDQLEGTGTVIIDAHAGLDMPEEAFFDAYHLNRPEAQVLTRFVAQQLAEVQAPTDHLVGPDGGAPRQAHAAGGPPSKNALAQQRD